MVLGQSYMTMAVRMHQETHRMTSGTSVAESNIFTYPEEGKS